MGPYSMITVHYHPRMSRFTYPWSRSVPIRMQLARSFFTPYYPSYYPSYRSYDHSFRLRTPTATVPRGYGYCFRTSQIRKDTFLSLARVPTACITTTTTTIPSPSPLDLRFPATFYAYTRSLTRTIVLHVGPTNSGKTYAALTALQNARNGVYAGPLRLLAWEIYERLNKQGVPCNLLTGQEYETVPNANHISATVEMVDTLMNNTVAPLDVLVLDEIQMIGDRDRGWAWTRVLLGAPVKELHACGDPTVVPLIRRLIGQTPNDTLIVKEYERLSPLRMDASPVRGWNDLQRGDVVVAFGRKQLYEHKRNIERSTGLRVGLVYGSLPPSVRREQAQKFNYQASVVPQDGRDDEAKEGKGTVTEIDSGGTVTSATATDILCASDAIGMGLNLAIRRIIFTKIRKFDGTKHRELTISEMKQISGRAGRYKSVYPEGFVTAMTVHDAQTIATALQSPSLPIRTAGLLPLMDHLVLYALSFAPVEWYEEYGDRVKDGKVEAKSTMEGKEKRDEGPNDEDDSEDTQMLLEYDAEGENGGNEENTRKGEGIKDGSDTVSPTTPLSTVSLPSPQGLPKPVTPPLPSFTWASSIALADRVVHYLLPYSKLLEYFESHARIDKQSYFLCSMEDLIRVARLLDDIPLPFRIRYTFCQAPVDIEDEMVVRALRRYARTFLRDGKVPVRDKRTGGKTGNGMVIERSTGNGEISGGAALTVNNDVLSVVPFMTIPSTAEELARMESLHATMDLYLWLGRKFPSEFVEIDEAIGIAQQTEQLISQGIHKMGDNHVAYARQQLRKKQRSTTARVTSATHRQGWVTTVDDRMDDAEDTDNEVNDRILYAIMDRARKNGKRKGKGKGRKEADGGGENGKPHRTGSPSVRYRGNLPFGLKEKEKENRKTKNRKSRSVIVEDMDEWVQMQKRRQEEAKEEAGRRKKGKRIEKMKGKGIG